MCRYLIPALAVLAFGASPAVSGTVRADVRVSHADLDLSLPEDVDILMQRLHAAAAEACTQIDITHLAQPASFKWCQEGAYRRALAALAKRVPQQVAARD